MTKPANISGEPRDEADDEIVSSWENDRLLSFLSRKVARDRARGKASQVEIDQLSSLKEARIRRAATV
ncbi:hypothetical protein [uncultured Erythrobacter sp.]|uniref:hypothetical protein n=1 Tax=uncultured Erythrobacter sp. TaxID=263913 RepID=UPI00262C5CB2|nr:hypothetical protein [uncultured Erythrobacter sp.]